MRAFGAAIRAGIASVATATAVCCQVRLQIEWSLPPGGVAFGDAFVVEVRRAWGSGDAEPFDAGALSPLELEPIAPSAPAVAGSDIVRFRARALAAGELVFAPVPLRLVGRAEPVAWCTPGPLAVRSVLPEPAGPIEWPGDVLDAPRGPRRAWWLLAGALLLVAAIRWWRRAPAAPAPSAPVPRPLHESALERLAALLPPGSGAAERLAFYTQLAAIVREHAGARFGFAAAPCTTPEVERRVAAGREPLARCLLACDLVKFAADAPSADEHAAAHAAATEFVRATVVEGTP
ncbi:MAG: hypothetical protein JNK78_18640 [Planctomycetes bacterium]|nr:hypothetical protein [Planctomycetota bacterium]